MLAFHEVSRVPGSHLCFECQRLLFQRFLRCFQCRYVASGSTQLGRQAVDPAMLLLF